MAVGPWTTPVSWSFTTGNHSAGMPEVRRSANGTAISRSVERRSLIITPVGGGDPARWGRQVPTMHGLGRPVTRQTGSGSVLW